MAYTPGVAHVTAEATSQEKLVHEYTSKWNSVAIVCDVTTVLELRNVVREAALVVMKSRSVIFKMLAYAPTSPMCIPI